VQLINYLDHEKYTVVNNFVHKGDMNLFVSLGLKAITHDFLQVGWLKNTLHQNYFPFVVTYFSNIRYYCKC